MAALAIIFKPKFLKVNKIKINLYTVVLSEFFLLGDVYSGTNK